MTQKAKWVVDTKGGPGGSSWELTVLRDDNEHGKRSYGWYDEDKLIISSSTSGSWEIEDFVWRRLLTLAQKLADDLNNKESYNAQYS